MSVFLRGHRTTGTGLLHRVLSSGVSNRSYRPTESERQQHEADELLESTLWGKLQAGPAPRFRSEPPTPPSTHHESWAPATLVSAHQKENVLQFSTRFYIDSTGEQPEYANKVELVVKVRSQVLEACEPTSGL